MRERSLLGDVSPILIATFFLLLPVVLVLIFANKVRATGEGRMSRDDTYTKAIIAAMLPDASQVSHSLLSVDLNQPLTVVAWMRQKQIPDYKSGLTPKGTWVTVVPKLKSFCQDYVKSNGADLQKLTSRLEQRLGLPPNAGYDTFVELKLEPKELGEVSRFFRPCGDPSPITNSCDIAIPPEPDQVRNSLDTPDKAFKDFWYLSKYYWSFASPKKDRWSVQYPWSGLGYTFDWAPAPNGGDDFVRWGESEFVVAPKTAVQFVSATGTADYCAPQ